MFQIPTNREISNLDDGSYKVTMSIGCSIFANFGNNLHKAKVEVAYQALMKTEYGFSELPGVLAQHRVSGMTTG